MPGDYELPDPPQAGNQKEGQIYGWTARVARKILRAITSKLHVL